MNDLSILYKNAAYGVIFLQNQNLFKFLMKLLRNMNKFRFKYFSIISNFEFLRFHNTKMKKIFYLRLTIFIIWVYKIKYRKLIQFAL